MGSFSLFSLLSGLIALFFYVLIFLVFFCYSLLLFGDFEYLWVSWIIVFNSIKFLQVRCLDLAAVR